MITQSDLLTTVWTSHSVHSWPSEWHKYAVIGDPIKHSLSPAIHNALFRALQEKHPNLANGYYGKIHVKHDELKQTLCNLHEQGFRGINVTVPHKVKIIDYLSGIDAIAEQMGAVNTLIWEEGGYRGYNTDGYGLVQALNNDLKVNLAETAVVIIGAGGAAQTAAAVCLQAGCPELWITNRSQERLGAVIHFLNTMYNNANRVHTFALRNSLPESLPKCSLLIIQTTSLGLHADDEIPIQLDMFDSSCKLFDVIYNPWETSLITEANKRGLQTANGLSMFLYQAAKAFKLWTGIEPDLEFMRSIALSHLQSSASTEKL